MKKQFVVNKGYYFITDNKLSKAGNISDVKSALDAGVNVVQYRNKSADTKYLYLEANRLREICKDIIFLVNDRIDVALAVDADGVHIGQSDMPYEIARKILGPDKIIGITVHNINEAINAYRLGANYIAVSPIFPTDTKPDSGIPCGIELLAEVRKILDIPIVAIGGIKLSNVKEVFCAGADAVCAISAVLTSEDVKSEIKRFQDIFLESKTNNYKS